MPISITQRKAPRSVFSGPGFSGQRQVGRSDLPWQGDATVGIGRREEPPKGAGLRRAGSFLLSEQAHSSC